MEKFIVGVLIVAALVFVYQHKMRAKAQTAPWQQASRELTEEEAKDICVGQLMAATMNASFLPGGEAAIVQAKEDVAHENDFKDFEDLNRACVQAINKYGQPEN